MTSAVASGPIPLSRVWAKGKVIAEDLTGEDLSDVLQLHADASAWWVLPRDPDYGAAELRDVAAALELDDLAIRDLLATDRRAKFEAIGSARLVVTNYVTHDPQTRSLTAHPISIIATDRVLICLVSADSFRPGRLLQQQVDVLADGGVEVGLQLLITAVINTYESALQSLQDSTEELSKVLYAQVPLNPDQQLHAFRLRTALVELRRLTGPMRGVLADIAENPPPAPKGKRVPSTRTVRRWATIAEQHSRVADAADALREVLASVLDTSLALAEARTSVTVRRSLAWAAVLAVALLVTGIAGTNLGFPLRDTALGFWLYLAVTAIAAAAVWLFFRRRHWV